MKVCIIPARGGSKRIPKKNIKIFAGKPIIRWSIEAAIKSNCFDKIIVSTDDIEIENISKISGAEVPFIRPKQLADDHTPTAPVVAHAIKKLEEEGGHVEFACCIYPTAPFLLIEDLKNGLTKINESQWSFVFSACTFGFPIHRSFELDSKTKGIKMFFPEHFWTRSQDLPEAWQDAGQFYWGTRKAWLEKLPFFSDSSTVVPLPRWRVQDIDTFEDWERAEKIFMVSNLEK